MQNLKHKEENMSGNIRTIIVEINKNCDDLDFISARRLIELNLIKLSEANNYRLLNNNAKILIKHVISENNNENHQKLTRKEMLIVNNINEYCTKFDISMLKRTLNDSIELLQRPDVLLYLNEDAKIILHNMGAILGAPQIN